MPAPPSIQAQSRLYFLDPVKSVEHFQDRRLDAVNAMYRKMADFGQAPVSYDIRPTSPKDDWGATNNFGADWSVTAANFAGTGGTIASADDNSLLSLSIAQNQFNTPFGISIETPTPVETNAKWKSGSDIRDIWLLAEMENIDHPRVVLPKDPSRLYTDSYGPQEKIALTMAGTASIIVTPAFYCLTGEQRAVTITGGRKLA